MMRSSPTLIVRNGTIVDGGGVRAPFLGDVAIAHDRIVGIGEIPDVDGAEVIDATALVVAPGFIDIHSHSDFTLLIDPRAVSQIAQGVTTEVIGNCGYGCCPIGDPTLAREAIYGFTPSQPLTWRDAAGYFENLRAAGPAVNVVTLVPNGQLRLAAVGVADRPAAPDELRRMKALLEEALAQGAAGYSTGLEYAAERGAPEEEITELCTVVARYGRLYATHTRNRDEKAIEAIDEAIRTACRSDARLQISHITPRRGHADAVRALDQVTAARSRGLDVAFDMHTRLFGTTYLKALLPIWAFEGGRDALIERLCDPTVRDQFRAYRSLITAVGDWTRIVLLESAADPSISRLDFAEISRRRGKPPFDCAMDVLLAEVDQIHRPMVILKTYADEDLRMTYTHEACTIGSDATALAPDGPLAESMFHGAYSWASWFYRRMVRETQALSLVQAIHKMTGQPAERVGIPDRGVLKVGAHADLAVFDPETFGETATTFEPNRLAVGMAHVFVNGIATMRHGAMTGTRAGEVVRFG